MSTKRKVYTFYIIAILVMVLVLMLFDLNIMAKAIVGLMIVFCIFVMRSIQTAYTNCLMTSTLIRCSR